MHKFKPRLGSQIDRETQPFPVNSYPKGYVFNIFIQEALESPEDFVEAVTALNMASPDDDVIVHLNCGGGDLSAVDTLLFEMSKCQGHIHIKASGTIASAATLILLAAHSYEMSPYTNILFHSASFCVGGKTQDVVGYAEFSKKQTEKLMRDYYEYVLSEEELHNIFVNKHEHWMDSEEFCARFEKAQDIRKELHDAEQKAEYDTMMGELEDDLPDPILKKLTKQQLIAYIKAEIDVIVNEDGSFDIAQIEEDENN